MNKRLTIGIVATLLAATVTLVAAGPYRWHANERRKSDQRLAANERVRDGNPGMQVFAPRYGAAPRIILVPQASDYDAGDHEAAWRREDTVVPPPRLQRRIMPSAPPPSQELTPIYPTPKFDTGGARSEKFVAPDEAAMPRSATRRQN